MPSKQESIDLQAERMDLSTDDFSKYFQKFDRDIYHFWLRELENYPKSDGRLASDYDYTDSFSTFDKLVLGLLVNSDVVKYVNSGIRDFDALRKDNIALHNELNGLGLSKNNSDYVLDLQGQIILNDLTTESALRTWFINPFKASLSTALETGASVATVRKFLDAWYKKESQSGILSGGRSIPQFEQYANQLARDAVFKTNNAMNNSVREVFGAEKFRYGGTLMKDSRGFCVYLKKLNRLIEYAEVPQAAKNYPQGLMKPFTIDTFSHNCGGYNCRHQQFPIVTR